MLKLKLQYFGHLMWRADSFEKTLMLGKIEGRGEGDDRGWDGWMASATHGHEFAQTPGNGEGQGGLMCCSPWGLKESDTTDRLNNNNNLLAEQILNKSEAMKISISISVKTLSLQITENIIETGLKSGNVGSRD